MRRVFDTFRYGFRLATPLESQFLELFNDDCCFVPNLAPLTRPASEDDVKAGRAVFQLNGKGKLAPLHLPAVASLSRPLQVGSFAQRPKLLMIVQAEIDTDGKTIYGVIGDGAARKAHPDEPTDIKPIRKSFFDSSGELNPAAARFRPRDRFLSAFLNERWKITDFRPWFLTTLHERLRICESID
jgi:hypothetical protein